MTITNENQEILIGENSTTVLEFKCKATGQPTPKLTWVRGGESTFIFTENDTGIMLITFPAMLILTLNVSETDSSTLGSEEGIPYFCLASNVLGTARSRAVNIRYPGTLEKE